jgi:hypothetical protein
MKKAWIENAQVRDIAAGNPSELHHPDVAAFYDTDVPDNATNGDGWVNGELVKPTPPAPVAPVAPVIVPPKVSPVEFKLLFTAPERIGIKTSTDPVVQDFFEIVNDPRLTLVDLGLQSTQDALSYLASLGLISVERRAEILLGQVQ